MPEDLVGIGQEHEKRNGFLIVIGIPDQLRINDHLDFPEFIIEGGGIHGNKVFPQWFPGLVVNINRIVHEFTGIFWIKVLERITLSFVDPLRNFPESLREGFLQVEVETQLPVIELKTVALKKFPVVWEILVHSKGLWDKSFDQAAPVGVILPEVDGAVHGLIPVFP